jgi:hypothetical protein
MPEIPGVQTLQPVDKPEINEKKAGEPGQAIAELGETSTGLAIDSLKFQEFTKNAQASVDVIAARNQLHAAFQNIQDQLAKTQNSRDVEGIIQQGKKDIADVGGSWAKSPAAVAIQQDAQALDPSLSHVGTIKQIDLMTKEGKIQLTQAAQTYSQDYAKARGNGDPNAEKASLDAYTNTVQSLVNTGLMGDAEAKDSIRAFRESGQELQIRNAISNADPSANEKVHEEMANHPEMFPDVTSEKLDTYKGQALAAFESHTKFQEWSEGQDAVKTKLVPLINLHTNPANRQFNEGEALKDIADQVTAGTLTPYQEKVLSEDVRSHAAELSVVAKQEGQKKLDSVEDLLSKHQFGAAKLQMEQDRGWFEENGLGADHAAELHYMNQMESQQRAEASADRSENRYEYMMKRQVAQDNSNDTFNALVGVIAQGADLTKSDIYGMTGEGKGKLTPVDAARAWKTMQAYQTEPDFKAGIDYINGAFAPAKGSSNDVYGANDKAKSDTLKLFQQQVNAEPNKSKLQIAHEIVKSKGEEQVKEQANKMFGAPSTGSIFSSIAKLFFAPNVKDGPLIPASSGGDGKGATIVQHSPSTGQDRYSTDGGKTWQPGKPQQ